MSNNQLDAPLPESFGLPNCDQVNRKRQVLEQNLGGKTFRVFNFVVLMIAILISASTGVADEAIDFNRQIRPLLADRCYTCHGPDQTSNQSGLRLDQPESALGEAPSGNGIVFVPGDLAASVAWQRINSEDDSDRMPPGDSHLALSPKEKNTIKLWIEQGARFDRHWAFESVPDVTAVPTIRDAPWVRNEIDAFVLDSLGRNEQEPAAEAERWRWLRRVTLDLTGLPPTPDELRAFMADESADAFEKVVDRLLHSRQFGEHQAISWLDAARYADSFGYQSDLLSPTWPWRDWVVRNINNNLRYDEFLTWQMAGDLLPNASREQKLATAFNRLHRQTNEGGSIPEEWRTEYVADRVNTFGTAVMGMTFECARCHDHRFDPVSQREYYNLFAFFNSIDEFGLYLDSTHVPTPTLALPTEDQSAAIETAEAGLIAALKKIADFDSETAANSFPEWKAQQKQLDFAILPVAAWNLDERAADGSFPNTVTDGKPASGPVENETVDGHSGKALRFSGDNSSEFPAVAGQLDPTERYSVSFWMKRPEDLGDCVILHRQQGTDVGFHGTELILDAGRLRFAAIRFWPGEALAIKSNIEVPANEWVHVVVSNDGSGKAEGMRLWINGNSDNTIIKNNLYKAPGVAGSTGFFMGERFRSTGFKGGCVDEVQVFDRPLSGPETRMSRDGLDSLATEGLKDQDLFDHFLQTNPRRIELADAVSTALQHVFSARSPVNETMVMEETETPQPAWVLFRGDYDAEKSDTNRASRSTPECLSPFPNDAPRDRLGLAQWTVSPNHPLTSRVAVNRIWRQFFEVGLVDPPGDFGLQGTFPQHIDLLNWLARDFMKHGWDVKRLCRQIVLSATYRQTSVCSAQERRSDPDNLQLARGPAQRLTAEMVRDLALFSSGLLNDAPGGPPVSPYQPADIWRENNTMTPAYQQSVGRELYRRSLYTVWKRTAPIPNMSVFDATSREVCSVARGRTNTPLQALVLMNDVQFVEAMRVLAESVMRQFPNDSQNQIEEMFVRLAGRIPEARELALLTEMLTEQKAFFASDEPTANQLREVGEMEFDDSLDSVDVAALTMLAQAILNSDAVIWKR